MSVPALAMVGVGFTRDGRDLLDGVDWRVEADQDWVVIGLNGSGKTSLIRIAALYEHPSRGTVDVLGERLGRTDASITELAGTFRMTLTGIKKHVGVLEEAGLVTTAKAGRVRTCRLGPRRLDEAVAWLEHYRQLWHARFDALDRVVEDLKQREAAERRPRRK